MQQSRIVTFPVDQSVFVLNPVQGSWCLVENSPEELLCCGAQVPRTRRGRWSDPRLLDSLSKETEAIRQTLKLDQDPRRPITAPSDHKLPATSRLPFYFVLHMTDGCNLSCRYCYANSTGIRSPRMTATIADQAIALALTSGSRVIGIQFHGGEPLLAWPAIRSGIPKWNSWAESKRKKLRFSIQTNGTLLNKETVHEMSEWDFDIGISLDGPRTINDRNRRYPDGESCFHDVVKGIRLCRHHGISVGILSVVINSSDILQVVNFCLKEGIGAVKLSPVFRQGRCRVTLNDARKTAEAHLETFEMTLDVFERTGQKLWMTNLAYFVEIMVNPGNPWRYMCMRRPCGAGRDMLAISSDGWIYPCERFASFPRRSRERYKLGHVSSCSDADLLVDHWVRSVGDRRPVSRGCQGCIWTAFCGGSCLADSLLHGTRLGLSADERASCEYYQRIWEGLMPILMRRWETIRRLYELDVKISGVARRV